LATLKTVVTVKTVHSNNHNHYTGLKKTLITIPHINKSSLPRASTIWIILWQLF